MAKAHRETAPQAHKTPETEHQKPLFETDSRLIGFLPAIYQEGNVPGHPSFLARYLDAFEVLLVGNPKPRRLPDSRGDSGGIRHGIEEKIIALPQLFSPFDTPEEFLPWLASWAALSFHPHLPLDRRRTLLADIVPLYGIRGTPDYLARLLEICVPATATVRDRQPPSMQIKSHSTIGKDTYLSGGPPHYFVVALDFPDSTVEEQKEQVQIAQSVIELAKPAHTVYSLQIATRGLAASPVPDLSALIQAALP